MTVENGESLERSELAMLSDKERNLAEYYTRRFIDFMSFNQSSYPEYTSNTNDDIHPLKDSVFQGWVL